ncbi:MAG: hypothetical protein EA401_08340 [Planctomycetota bacterium]|nr:MAG: hypothetical protein EA401_08340 [Planctomycetota bacterium]
MRRFILAMVLIVASHGVAMAMDRGPSSHIEDQMLRFMQPVIGLRWHTQLGVEADLGVIFGVRSSGSEGLIVGPMIHGSWTQTGWRYGAGIGAATWSGQGGGGSLVLRYSLIDADKSNNDFNKGVDYHGLEATLGVFGASGGYSLNLGAYEPVDGGDRFYGIGLGFGL